MELNVIQHLKSYWDKIKFIGLTDKDEEFADATSEHSVRASKFLKGLNLDPIMDEIKISVIVSDKFCILELPGPDGKIDQNTAIFGYDERFRKWCHFIMNKNHHTRS